MNTDSLPSFDEWLERAERLAYQYGTAMLHNDMSGVESTALLAHLAAHPSAAPQGAQPAEPVAVRYKNSNGRWRYLNLPFTKGWTFPESLGTPEPLYASPADAAPVPQEARMLLDDEMQALSRFCETCEDGQPYDVPKERMQRLAELGVIHWRGASRYEMTAFGQYVLDLLPDGWPRLPLKTHADHDAYSRAAMNAGLTIPAKEQT